ncbi:MAG: phospholipase D-like domain-containing protein [Marmoricola sp.]
MTLLLMGGLLTIPVAASNAAAIAPAPGPLANNPMTKKNKRVVIRKINNAIDATVPGSDIYIASWNMLREWGAVNKLLRAQKRGVRVLLIAAKENSSTGRQKGKRMTNKYFTRLSRGLAKGNRFVAPERRSGTKLCAHSCRGTTGIAHTKFYLFSQAGAATNVVMYGSANLTDLAATNQWNDIFTVVGNPEMYSFIGQHLQPDVGRCASAGALHVWHLREHAVHQRPSAWAGCARQLGAPRPQQGAVHWGRAR